MKIYLSGDRSNIEEARQNYMEANNMLEDMGFIVVNPLHNALDDYSLERHIANDIGMLIECDVIFLLKDWRDSKEACIEFDIASLFGIEVLFQSNFIKFESSIVQLQNAIHEVIGMAFKEYTTDGRQREGFYARMIFAHHCHNNKMSEEQIGRLVNRNHSSINYTLKKFNDEYRLNSKFRSYAQQVQKFLNDAYGTKDCRQ